MLVVLTAPVIVPLVLLLALVVLLDGGNPFYSQERIGRNGRHYRIWKLRSMVVNADQRLAEYLEQNPGARAEWDNTQKLRDDPRVTRFGRILRKCSLDELPQLWNVFRGDMSLVGPRPEVPRYMALYPDEARQRILSVRPGITDRAAIEFRDEELLLAHATDPERVYVERIMPVKLRYYLDYVAHRSLAGDARILFDTVRALLR